MSAGTLPAAARPAAAPAARSKRDRARRWLLVALGCLMVGIGTLGIFVPGLPTTIFLLAASWLFAKSCPRLERALHAHRWFGPYLAMAKDGMPRRAKVITLAAMWTGIGVSVWLLDDAGAMAQGAVILAGAVGTAALLRFVRTSRAA